jgi:hypothetical protein
MCATMHMRVAYCQFDANAQKSRLTWRAARMRSSKESAVDLSLAESTGLEDADSSRKKNPTPFLRPEFCYAI